MNTGTLPTLVCVVDDDDMVRESICMLLRTVGLGVRGYATAAAFLADPDAARCDCLVLDVRMPGLSGPELQQRLADECRRTPVIFVSGHGNIPMAVKAMRLGALDFLQKPFPEQALLDRVQQGVALSHEGKREAAQRAALTARLALLTARERDVLDGLRSGSQNKQIAEALGISVRTVEQYRAQLMRKMRVDSLAELVEILARADRT